MLGAVRNEYAFLKKLETEVESMNYLKNIIVACFSNTLFIIFLIAILGYFLGQIKIKGVSLGTAGVFLTALLFGHFGYAESSLLQQTGLVNINHDSLKTSLNIIQNIGLLCFVTAVGFIAGPHFFHNLKKNAKSYVLLAVVIIATGSLVCLATIFFTPIDSAMSVGLLSGALTTTPGFAAAQEVVRHNEFLLNEVTVGHAIGYPFGVVGVVLFVQLIPKLLRADMAEERKKMFVSYDEAKDDKRKKIQNYVQIDPIGMAPFSLAVILGVLLGKIYIPLPAGAHFSLGNTGGALIVGLILGHFGHIGKINMLISSEFLKAFREFGLVMFLIGAGVPGGSGFIEIIQQHGFILFIYGALMTLAPMFVAYFCARKVVKLCLFNSLGSITGGMTSTPALGALINVAGTDDIAASYAATYPVALILITLASQFMVSLF